MYLFRLVEKYADAMNRRKIPEYTIDALFWLG